MGITPKGFEVKDDWISAPEEDGSGVVINVNPESERLQLLAPFEPIGNTIDGAKLVNQSAWKMYD